MLEALQVQVLAISHEIEALALKQRLDECDKKIDALAKSEIKGLIRVPYESEKQGKTLGSTDV